MKRESLAEMGKRCRSEDGQVWTYILKIFLVALVIGLIISQCGPIIANHISTRGTASDAADLAAHTYNTRKDMEKVTEEVTKLLDERNARLDGNISLIYDETGRPQKISVPVRRIVNTFLFEHVGYLAPLTEAHAGGECDLFR